MCLILHGDAGTILENETLLADAFRSNDDGWGIMYADAGRIRIRKGFKYETLAERLAEQGDRELFVHLRFATHGDVNMRNNHPFLVQGGRYALMHNGIIPIECWDKRYSDTWHFARKIEKELADHPHRFGSRKTAKRWAKQVGWSRLVLLRADGEVMFVNKSDGCEYRGLWLSNDNHVPGRWSRKGLFKSLGTIRTLDPPAGESWYDDGLGWNPGYDRAESAIADGIGVLGGEPYYDPDLDMWLRWDEAEQDFLPADIHDIPADRRYDEYLRWHEHDAAERLSEDAEEDFQLYG